MFTQWTTNINSSLTTEENLIVQSRYLHFCTWICRKDPDMKELLTFAVLSLLMSIVFFLVMAAKILSLFLSISFLPI